MNRFEFAACLIATALAFRDKVGEEETKGLLNHSEEAEDHDEEELYVDFDSFCRNHGVQKALQTSVNRGDFRCIARAGIDEPVFTLRAQDITSSACVRNWMEMQRLNPAPESDNWRMIDRADDIARAMDQYEPKKWAD